MSADLVLRLRQLRLCEPYPINPDGPDAADEIERLRAENEQSIRKIETLEQLRPHWAKGYSDDSLAAQASTAALSELWKLLRVKDQTAAANEIERLRKMIRNAYNDGFIEGMRDVTSSRGGIPWGDCKYRAALEEVKK